VRCTKCGCDSQELERECAKLREQLAAAKAELTKFAAGRDEMSFHGELLRCKICGGIGTQAGMKRGVGYEPVKHKLNCILAEADRIESGKEKP